MEGGGSNGVGGGGLEEVLVFYFVCGHFCCWLDLLTYM